MKPHTANLRQRFRRIETTPKPVHVVQFQDFAGIGNSPELSAELDLIIDSIERGDGVPEVHYRAGIDRDEDSLLADRGIMHLHLGGKNIVALTQAWFQSLEHDMAMATVCAMEAGTEAERKGAEKIRDKRAASIAAFKAKAELK